MKLLFPKHNYNVLSANSYVHIHVFCERLIYFQDRSVYFEEAKYVELSWEYINRSQTHECVNVGIGTEAAQFPEKECINGIFLAVCWWRKGVASG